MHSYARPKAMIRNKVPGTQDRPSEVEVTQETFLDEPPEGPVLTSYDREHIKLYLRLLDAEAEGADWEEVVEILFGIDLEKEPHRAARVHTRHLARAKWLTENGYRDLIRSSYQ